MRHRRSFQGERCFTEGGILNKCGGSREMHMGDAGCMLASDDTGEMKKKPFCGRSYILLMELGNHPVNIGEP